MHGLPTATSRFEQRTSAFFTLAAKGAREWFSPDGNWLAKGHPMSGRERFWLCFALYAENQNRWADAIVRQAPVDNSAECGCPTNYNIFHTNIALVLLLRHGGQMAPDVKAKLEALVREGFSFSPGNRFADFQFHGYNDNFPAKTSMALILGGEMFGEPEVVEHGMWNLRRFYDLLRRRGINSEFNSPTYTPLTIHAMSEIADHAICPEAREMAKALEERLWIDLAARFHPETGFVAGPYSRAYIADLLGQLSNVASLLWFVLGDAARPSPLELFNADSPLVFHHEGDRPFGVAQMCWFAIGHYHLPDAAWALFSEKSYPFHAVATSECGDWGHDFPARPVRTETYMEADFTVSTSSTPMTVGWQSAPYFVTYRRASLAPAASGYGTVFSRFLINDQVPGKFPPGGRACDEASDLTSHGNVLGVQSDATVLLLSQPHLMLGGDANQQERKGTPLSRLREAILFPLHGGGLDELIVGGIPRANWEGEVRHGEWVVCRRGRLLMAIRPLAHTGITGSPKIELTRENNYQLLTTTFYDGPERLFPRSELAYIYGGFVAEHASLSEYNSLAEFAREFDDTEFLDYYWTTRLVRYRRGKGLKYRPLEIEVSCSNASTQPRFVQINGNPVAWPPVAIDGVVAQELPILRDPWKPIPGGIPWKSLRVSDFQATHLGTPGTDASVGDI